MPAERVKQYLRSQGAEFETRVHERKYTAQETAAATHVTGRELAKTVVLQTEEGLVIVVVPASSRVHLGKARAALGVEKARLADEAEFSNLFPECEMGAMPPLGRLFAVDMWMDSTFKEKKEVAFPAGTHTEIVKMSLSDFEQLEDPKFVNLTD